MLQTIPLVAKPFELSPDRILLYKWAVTLAMVIISKPSNKNGLYLCLVVLLQNGALRIFSLWPA